MFSRQERREQKMARRIKKVELRKEIMHRRVNSSPYLVEIKNTTTETKKAILFGFNSFWRSATLGSDEGIEITSLGSDNYSLLVAQSVSKAFILSKLRLQSNGDIPKQINYITYDANGQMNTHPILLDVNLYQFQTNIIDINTNLGIDGNSFFEIEVPANTNLRVTMLPTSVFSQLRAIEETIRREDENGDYEPKEQLQQATQEIVRNVKKETTWKLKTFFVELWNKIKAFKFKKQKPSNLSNLDSKNE